MFEKYQDLINYVQSLFTKPVYLVGGSLRDILLDRVPKDFDFATALTTEEIKEQLKGKHRAYLTGQKFGTIGFRVDTNDIEVTTFRTESYSDGNRKPEVKFIDNIIPDLQRRDFTVNAIAYHDGKIIDPCGGRLDLLGKILKPVGTPKKMFKDDSLRLLRLARFASQLEFAVDQNLACQTKKYAYKFYKFQKKDGLVNSINF